MKNLPETHWAHSSNIEKNSEEALKECADNGMDKCDTLKEMVQAKSAGCLIAMDCINKKKNENRNHGLFKKSKEVVRTKRNIPTNN